MGNSTRRRRSRNYQAAKPHPDFPLCAHPSGRWCKRVRGRLHYFGKLDDPQAALERWLAEKDDLLAGRVPRDKAAAGATLRERVNRFLTTKTMLRDNGELSVHSFRDYYRTCERLVETFGRHRLLTDLLPEDFEKLRAKITKGWGPVRLGNEINRVRVVFNYAYKSGIIDRPMRYGEGFRRPSKQTLRKARADKGPRMFKAEELRRLIDAAPQPLRAMVLLGVNAGLGNADVGTLPMKALDLEGGWLNFPRPKTGVERRCPLWPETVEALKEWLAARPAPKNEADAELVFLTAKGGRWAKDTTDNPVSKETRKLLDRLDINGNRNFYALRHTFETVGGGSRDQVAVNAVMGHTDESMAAAYREHIEDERLRAVVEHVRRWLFNRPADSATAAVN